MNKNDQLIYMVCLSPPDAVHCCILADAATVHAGAPPTIAGELRTGSRPRACLGLIPAQPRSPRPTT